MFFSTASEAKREVKSLISIKMSMNSENSGHLWHKMSQIYFKKLRAHLQISSYFWVFWGKIQLSNGHKVSWFWVGWKILLDLIFPHVGLSSMPFWSKYTDPPTSMICGFKKEHMLKKIIKLLKSKTTIFHCFSKKNCFENWIMYNYFNILKKLIPHIMKVGGSVYLLQNGMDDSPMCGNEFPGKNFRPNPNQLTCWALESWILPQNSQK